MCGTRPFPSRLFDPCNLDRSQMFSWLVGKSHFRTLCLDTFYKVNELKDDKKQLNERQAWRGHVNQFFANRRSCSFDNWKLYRANVVATIRNWLRDHKRFFYVRMKSIWREILRAYIKTLLKITLGMVQRIFKHNWQTTFTRSTIEGITSEKKLTIVLSNLGITVTVHIDFSPLNIWCFELSFKGTRVLWFLGARGMNFKLHKSLISRFFLRP